MKGAPPTPEALQLIALISFRETTLGGRGINCLLSQVILHCAPLIMHQFIFPDIRISKFSWRRAGEDRNWRHEVDRRASVHGDPGARNSACWPISGRRWEVRSRGLVIGRQTITYESKAITGQSQASGATSVYPIYGSNLCQVYAVGHSLWWNMGGRVQIVGIRIPHKTGVLCDCLWGWGRT